jgi:aldose 1-epimerase
VSVKPVKEVAIRLFTIENKNGTRLIVSNCGAAVLSLFVKDKNGVLADVVLGYEDPTEYLDDEFYLGTIVGRYANRIAGDTVMIDDLPYKLSVREGSYHLHGGFSGFNKRIFKATEFYNGMGSGVIFKYHSPHLEEGFPGELVLEVIYTLDDNDNWTVEYKAVADRTTIINVTQHSYFNLSGRPDTPVDDHEIKINSDYYLPVNKIQVPTGQLADVADTPFDFTRFKKISKDIQQEHEQLELSNGYDHSWVLEREHTRSLKHAAIVKEPISGRRLDVYTTEPAVHFYTGNFLNNVVGKKGFIYNQRTGFCLETQHFPDAPNHPEFPSTILKAQEQFYSKTIFKFSVE